MEFEYLLYPFAGALDVAEASRLVAQSQVGVRTNLTDTLPDDYSFLRLTRNKTVVTAMKPAADGSGGIVRLWNPTSENQEEKIQLDRPATCAHRCNLNEEPIEELVLDNESVAGCTEDLFDHDLLGRQDSIGRLVAHDHAFALGQSGGLDDHGLVSTGNVRLGVAESIEDARFSGRDGAGPHHLFGPRVAS